MNGHTSTVDFTLDVKKNEQEDGSFCFKYDKYYELLSIYDAKQIIPQKW
jgi:hypothetical protein